MARGGGRVLHRPCHKPIAPSQKSSPTLNELAACRFFLNHHYLKNPIPNFVKMTTPPAQQNQPSRFKAPSNLTTSERLSTNTVGLVALSDFRKRRAEVLEQQEREARDAFKSNTSGTNTPASNNNSNNNDDARSRSATPNVNDDGSGGERSGTPAEKKVKRRKKALVSFGDDEEEDGGEAPALAPKKNKKAGKSIKPSGGEDTADPAADSGDGGARAKKPGKITANASVGVVPRALTKAALRREAAEREKLRKEFLSLQEAVKNTEVAIPFVFYDGTNTPGGTVRVRKGEFVWVFLDKSRKLGADLGVGGEKNSNVRREWARVGVDDLMLVRGTVIIPHVSYPSTIGGKQSRLV